MVCLLSTHIHCMWGFEKWKCLKKKIIEYKIEVKKEIAKEGRPDRSRIPCRVMKCPSLYVDKVPSTWDDLLPANGESHHCLFNVTRFIGCLWTAWLSWDGSPLLRWQMGHDCCHRGLWSVLLASNILIILKPCETAHSFTTLKSCLESQPDHWISLGSSSCLLSFHF
jgi:hypothetical protein